MLNIIYASNFNYIRGGSEKVCFSEIDLLNQHGHKAVHFSMNDSNSINQKGYNKEFPNTENFEDGALIPRIKVFMKMFYNPISTKYLKKIISKDHFQILHGHNIYTRMSHSVIHSAKKAGMKTIITLHDLKYVCPNRMMLNDTDICESCKENNFYKAIQTRCHKNSLVLSTIVAIENYFYKLIRLQNSVDVFICPSRFYIEKYKSMGFKGRLEYVPNFVDEIPKYIETQTSYSYLYFGRLSKEKGIMTLLEAMKKSTFKLDIIGEGPLKKEIDEFIASNCLSDQISCHGYMSGDALTNAIKKAKAIIVPSICYENAPMNVLEAMSMGKIVIASEVGGIPELIDDCGILFKMGDKDDLINQLEKFEELSHTDKEEMIKKAKKKIADKFTKEQHYKRLLEVYNSLLI